MDNFVKELIKKHGLEKIARPIMACLLPAIFITKIDGKIAKHAASKIGGLPDTPHDFIWPRYKNKPLCFIAQINCEELSEYDIDGILPPSGMLYFFYDVFGQPGGYEPYDPEGSRVIYTSNLDYLIQAELPSGIDSIINARDMYPGKNQFCIKQFQLSFNVCPSLPSLESITFLKAISPNDSSKNILDILTQTEIDSYIALLADLDNQFRLNFTYHQILGHSSNMQGDMQMECETQFNHWKNTESAAQNLQDRDQDIFAHASEWKLLFQIDSDDDLNIMWGDMGLVYFWLRNDSLQERKFEEVCTLHQCC